MGLQDYYNTGQDSSVSPRNEYWYAQTFIAGATYNISALKLMLAKVNSPLGNIEVAIRATSGDSPYPPTGADLTSGSISCSMLSTDLTWYGIGVTPYELTEGTRYAIVVRAPDASESGHTQWGMDNSGNYADGEVKESRDSGVTWPYRLAGRDCMFETYDGIYFYNEGTLVAEGTGSVLLSYEVSSAAGTLGVISDCSVLLSHESPLIIQSNCVPLLSYEFYKTIEWPEDRPDDETIDDKEWDEETGTWVDTTGGPGRHKNSVIAIGQGDANEGVIYFGDM